MRVFDYLIVSIPDLCNPTYFEIQDKISSDFKFRNYEIRNYETTIDLTHDK